nr:reverse transcriptase domain-containing protein [Tanacetum cinerariifolium]
MRQRCWLELLSDYDCDIRYNPGKANMVADALSRKERDKPLRVRALVMTISLNLLKQILEAQIKALKPENLKKEDADGMIRMDIPKERLEPCINGTLCLNDRSWLPCYGDLRFVIIDHASIKVTPYEALYGWKCRSPVCWAEVGEAQLIGPEMIQETTEKIILVKQRIQAAQDRQKSYADRKWKPTEFEVGDMVMLKLKKILIDKMEGNKSIQRSDEQRNLYKALVEAYEADKTILDSYGESTILKRRREDDDDQERPSSRSDWGSKKRREGREHASASTLSEPATRSAGRSTTQTQSRQMSASESAFTEEPVQTTCQMEEPSHLMFETGAEDQPIVQTSQHPKWFSEPRKPPTPDQLEYHLEEVYKAMTDQLDWVNPEGQQYPHNLLQPFPLIPDNRGRRVISFKHFINNDLEYLRGGASSRKYTTSVTKTKAADYGHIKWIEDLVPRTMWIQEPLNYDKHALLEVSHWGRKRQ